MFLTFYVFLVNVTEENFTQKTCVKLTSTVKQPSLANI